MIASLKLIRDLIGKDQIEEAIKTLLSLTKGNPDNQNRCLIFLNSYTSLKNKEIKQTIKFEDASVSRSKIVDALLVFIDTLENSIDAPFTHEDNLISSYREWSLLDKMKLVDLLLKCSALQTESGRNNIIQELPQEIQIRIQRGPNAQIDIKNILDMYSSFEKDISGFIQIVAIFEGQNNALTAVKAFLNRN